MSRIELQAWLPSSDLSGAPDATFSPDDQLTDAGFNPVLWGEGDGFLELHADNPDTQYLQRRGFIRAVDTDSGDGLFWWILEEATVNLNSSREDGGKVIRWDGRGMLYYLDRYKLGQAVWAPGQPWRGSYNVIDYWTWADQSMIAILTRFMEEGQSDTRADFLDKLTYDFDRTNDSNGNTPTDLTDYQVRIGTGGLTLAADAMRQGTVLQVLPESPPVLQAFRDLDEYRTDRSSATFAAGKVRFAAGANVATELPHKIVALRERTHTLTRRQDGQYATESLNGSGEPYMDFMEVPNTSDPDAVEAAAGQSHLQRQKQSAVAVIRHLLGPGGADGEQGYMPGPGSAFHYWLGDLVTVHTGTGEYDLNEQALEVAGIRYFLRGADWMVEAQLGAQVLTASGAPVSVPVGPSTVVNPPLRLCRPDVDNEVTAGSLIGAACSGSGTNHVTGYGPWGTDREERVEITISQAVPAGDTIILETASNRLWTDATQVYDEQGNTWVLDASHENTASSGDNYIQIWRCIVTTPLATGDWIRFAVNVGASLNSSLERGAKCMGAFTFHGELSAPVVGTGGGSFGGSANINTPAGDVVIAGLASWGTATMTDDVDWTDMIPRQLGNFGAGDNTAQLIGQYLMPGAATTWTVGFSASGDWAAIAVGYTASGASYPGAGPEGLVGTSNEVAHCDHNHLAEGLLTDETDTALVLHPDGAGGVEWGVDAGSGLAVEDEGTEEGSGIDRLDFTGAGVSVSVTGSQATIDIPGGGGAGRPWEPVIGWPSAFAGGGDQDFTTGSAGSYANSAGSAGTVSPLETSGAVNRFQHSATGLLVQTGTGLTQVWSITHTLADDEFMVCALSPGQPALGDNMSVALRLSNAGGEHITSMLEQDTTSYEIQGNSDSNATGTTLGARNFQYPETLLLAISRVGLNYAAWVSADGGSWRRIYTELFSAAMTVVELRHTCHSTAPAVVPFTRWLFVKQATAAQLAAGGW